MKKRTPILYEGGMYMGKVWLTNAFSGSMLLGLLNNNNIVNVKFVKVSLDDVKELLEKNSFTSVIGHDATANVLQTILGVDVKVNRVTVQLEKGDSVVVFQLNQRLPEGVILNEEELKKLDYSFILATVE